MRASIRPSDAADLDEVMEVDDGELIEVVDDVIDLELEDVELLDADRTSVTSGA